MLKRLIIPAAALLLVTGCSTSPSQQAVVAPPPPPPPMSFMMFFDWDSAKLTSQGQATAHQAAQAFKENNATAATIVGHTDTTGSNEYNQKLAALRSNVVKEALVLQGIPASAITAKSDGEAGPLVQTADQTKEPRNRRVEVIITK